MNTKNSLNRIYIKKIESCSDLYLMIGDNDYEHDCEFLAIKITLFNTVELETNKYSLKIKAPVDINNVKNIAAQLLK